MLTVEALAGSLIQLVSWGSCDTPGDGVKDLFATLFTGRSTVMAMNQSAHKTGGGIGGKANHETKEAKRARRVSNLAARADENRTRQKGNHQAPKAKK